MDARLAGSRPNSGPVGSIRFSDKLLDDTINYDGQRVLAEHDSPEPGTGLGTPVRIFIGGPMYIDEHLALTDVATEKTYTYVHESLHTPTLLLDGSKGVETYKYDAFGDVSVFTAKGVLLTESAYANPYYFTGRRLDRYDKEITEPAFDLYHYRARAYNPVHGRFLQRDPLLYVDGMNLYEYVRTKPTLLSDPTGKWGAEVHRNRTRRWAREVGMRAPASSRVGDEDIATDGLGTGWLPAIGDQSRHFNRNSLGSDSRLVWKTKELFAAIDACSGSVDNPLAAARHLGRSLHSLQDWWAHGAYSSGPGDVVEPHIAAYDNPLVDAEFGDSPDGRAPQVWIVNSFFEQQYRNWIPGTRRIQGTERDTKSVLEAFLGSVRNEGGCRCKIFYLKEKEWRNLP